MAVVTFIGDEVSGSSVADVCRFAPDELMACHDYDVL